MHVGGVPLRVLTNKISGEVGETTTATILSVTSRRALFDMNLFFVTVTVVGMLLPFTMAQCNIVWLFTSKDTCSEGFSLTAGQCYQATVYLNDGFWTKNDASLRVSCPQTECKFTSYKDNSCSDVDYSENMLGSGCNPLNPALTMRINGNSIWEYGGCNVPPNMTAIATNERLRISSITPRDHSSG